MRVPPNDNKNPKFIFDLNAGIIKILGRSTMNQPHNFYPSVISLIEEYAQNPVEKTRLIIDLEYYNSLSARYLLRIVELVSRIEIKKNHTVKITWHYDPDDKGIASDIKLFSKIIDFKIKAVAYELA